MFRVLIVGGERLDMANHSISRQKVRRCRVIQEFFAKWVKVITRTLLDFFLIGRTGPSEDIVREN